MLIRKYFSMSDVTKIIGIPAHRLRYIEKSDPNVKVIQIRGRRYYTQSNIDYIKLTYSTKDTNNSLEDDKKLNSQIISRIDRCIVNFRNLLENTKQIHEKR